MKKINYSLILPAVLSICACSVNYNIKITGNTSFILNELKTSYTKGEVVTIKTPSFHSYEDVIFTVNDKIITPTIDDYAHFDLEIDSDTNIKVEINGSSDFKLIKDLDEYKNFNFKDVVQVEYSSYEHYGYSPRYNYVSHNKVDIDIIVSKFYSPIVINDDSSFYGGNYESFKLISSNGESVKIEFYYKYLKNEEYQVFYSFDNLKTYDSIYYNFGMMNKIKLIENGIDSTSKTLNFSYIPFKEIDRTENIFPILLTESFGAEYECLEAYDETTFSLKTKFGTKYYQLMDHTFSELIS
jgi:hypothetical protein